MSSEIRLRNANNKILTLKTNDIINTDKEIYYVNTIDELEKLNNIKDKALCHVADENRGGTFIFDYSKKDINDSGITFNGWVRQYSGAVNIRWFNTFEDGIGDDAIAINKAIAVATDIYIPRGTFTIKSTINCNKALSLRGASSKPYEYAIGTILITKDISLVTISSSGVKISNLTLLNNGDTFFNYAIGTNISGKAWNIAIRDIVIRGKFYTAVDMSNTWNLTINNVRVEGGGHKVGFEIDHGTSAILTSCLSYGASDVGFKVHNMFYSSLISCGCDGGNKGLLLAGDTRGLSIGNFGCESLNSTHIKIQGGNSSITIDNPTLGANNGLVDEHLIDINGDSGSELSVTFTGLKLPSAYKPTGSGKLLNIDDSVATPNVVLINPVIYDNTSDFNKCVILGGENNNIITSGTNDNGRWVKQYDGSLICEKLTEVITVPANDEVTVEWDFPKEFITPPVVYAQWYGDDSDDCEYFTAGIVNDHSDPSLSKITTGYRIKSSSDADRNIRVSFLARGH